jgi:hypothetical protein
MFGRIKASKVNLSLWKNDLLNTKILKIFLLSLLENIPEASCCHESTSSPRFQYFKVMVPKFMSFAFPLKADIMKVSEDLQKS